MSPGPHLFHPSYFFRPPLFLGARRAGGCVHPTARTESSVYLVMCATPPAVRGVRPAESSPVPVRSATGVESEPGLG